MCSPCGSSSNEGLCRFSGGAQAAEGQQCLPAAPRNQQARPTHSPPACSPPHPCPHRPAPCLLPAAPCQKVPTQFSMQQAGCMGLQEGGCGQGAKAKQHGAQHRVAGRDQSSTGIGMWVRGWRQSSAGKVCGQGAGGGGSRGCRQGRGKPGCRAVQAEGRRHLPVDTRLENGAPGRVNGGFRAWGCRQGTAGSVQRSVGRGLWAGGCRLQAQSCTHRTQFMGKQEGSVGRGLQGGSMRCRHGAAGMAGWAAGRMEWALSIGMQAEDCRQRAGFCR